MAWFTEEVGNNCSNCNYGRRGDYNRYPCLNCLEEFAFKGKKYSFWREEKETFLSKFLRKAFSFFKNWLTPVL